MSIQRDFWRATRGPRKFVIKAGNATGKAVKTTVDTTGRVVMAPVKAVGKMLPNPIRDLRKAGERLLKSGQLALLPQNAVVVVYDDGTAETAGSCIASWLEDEGYDVTALSELDYTRNKKALEGKRVIIVGHHGIADRAKDNVTLQYTKYGMSYGISMGRKLCVVRVSHRTLSPKLKQGFARYYQITMSRYAKFARRYAIPMNYGKRKRTKTSQYDLICAIFVHEALPRFMEGAKKAEPPPSGGCQKPLNIDPSVILAQFRQDALESPYITGDYLRQFCKGQRKFAAPRSESQQEDTSEWEALLTTHGGWQIKQHRNRDAVRITAPDGTCCAAGTKELLLSPILNNLHAKARIDALKANGQLKYGIVFGGGGAKGAFQIGVWKWLAESGLADRFTGISGASVGALNTLLFAQGDYEKAERVWMNMQKEDLLQLNPYFLQGLGRFLSKGPDNLGLLGKGKLEERIRENISLGALRDKLAYVSLSAFTTTDEQVAQKVLSRAMQHIDLRWNGKGIPFDKAVMSAMEKELRSISCLEYAFFDGECEEPLETNVRKALASAAFPGAYIPVSVDGKLYMDGGLHDNYPVTPLINAGFQEIVVVHLSPKARREPFEQEGVKIWPVYPKDGLKDMFQISPELTEYRMRLGYEAAAYCLKDFR